MLEISRDDYEQLRELEESLWRAERRCDRDCMDATLAPDFLEFGRSDRVYKRDETLNIEQQPIHARLPLQQFAVHLITKEVALITCISEVTYGDEIERANRSSLLSRYRQAGGYDFIRVRPYVE